jgi:hypothetical protein
VQPGLALKREKRDIDVVRQPCARFGEHRIHVLAHEDSMISIGDPGARGSNGRPASDSGGKAQATSTSQPGERANRAPSARASLLASEPSNATSTQSLAA